MGGVFACSALLDPPHETYEIRTPISLSASFNAS